MNRFLHIIVIPSPLAGEDKGEGLWSLRAQVKQSHLLLCHSETKPKNLSQNKVHEEFHPLSYAKFFSFCHFTLLPCHSALDAESIYFFVLSADRKEMDNILSELNEVLAA